MPLPTIWRKFVRFGRWAEITGTEYLRARGYQILASPYRVREGEIDIVARDGECLVFVEVKARRSDPHPEDAVNPAKQRRIIRAASHYRSRHRLVDTPYRFDILTLVGSKAADPEFRLIEDAFREFPEH